MNHIKRIILILIILLVILSFRNLLIYKVCDLKGNVIWNEPNVAEKRGTPAYDYIIGTDGLPHFRVFFWVPINAIKYTPYTNIGINSNVSIHGAAAKWDVVETNKINKDEKLVFIYVPKTFVFLYGFGFEKVIHLYCSCYTA